MIFKTSCPIAKGLMDPAPLVNVVFLLLLFFLLSSTYVQQSGVGISLPGFEKPTVRSFQSLVVTVTSKSLLFFNNQPTTLADLQKALREEASRTPNQELIIKADKEAPQGMVVEIMNIAFKAGVHGINLATRPETPMTMAP
jgi:biopolymer transport protein ExbD